MMIKIKLTGGRVEGEYVGDNVPERKAERKKRKRTRHEEKMRNQNMATWKGFPVSRCP